MKDSITQELERDLYLWNKKEKKIKKILKGKEKYIMILKVHSINIIAK